MVPKWLLQKRLSSIINSSLKDSEILKRVNYYNKINDDTSLPDTTTILKDLSLAKNNSAYFFDSYEYIRFFKPHLKALFLFGDITYIPNVPSIVKSRPISDKNQNSVLLNLDKFRHFNFVIDRHPYLTKKDLLVWRGDASDQKPNRAKFLRQFFNHPLGDIGHTNTWDNNRLQKEKMTIKQQLNYKFILCLEGVDVATNLKWVMSSNSVAVMPKPKFETWFMEGTLIPDYHYMLIKDDYSDLEEKLNYFINHPQKALAIIDNAHQYINQFKNKRKEKLIALLVLQKYFEKTNRKAFPND